MSNLLLLVWEIAVAVGAFGWGAGTLHLLGSKRPPLALAGVCGVSLWIALGGWLNLLHLLRPSVFFVMVGAGVLLAVYRWLQFRRDPAAPEASEAARPQWTLSAKVFLAAAIVMIGIMMLGAVRPLLWTHDDDLQGYVPMAVKALQLHSIQPDPFCERRLVSGVGGATFLDAMMYANGTIRSMPFLDSTLGLFLYALSLWAIGRRWKVSATGLSFALFCLPFATLMKVNITIVYLSAAAFLMILLLLTEIDAEGDSTGLGWIAVTGIITGAICTTKATNVVFVVPLLIAFAVLRKFLQPKAKSLLPVALVLLVTIGVLVPYCIANKAGTGTYFFPILGAGDDVTVYHLIQPLSQLGLKWQEAIVVAPDLLFLGLALLVVWQLTKRWTASARTAVIAYLIAALVSVPITAHGTGGESADRYTAAFAMPALLLALLVVFAVRGTALRLWRAVGVVSLSVAGAYVFAFIGCKLDWYSASTVLAYEAVNRVPSSYPSYLTTLPTGELREQFEYGARVQAAIPPGATMLENVLFPYMFNFRRNTIDIQDYDGMASPAPGWPLAQGPEAARRFLIQEGISYVAIDKLLRCEPQPGKVFLPDWQNFLHHMKPVYPAKKFLRDQRFTHVYSVWSPIESAVTCRARQQLQAIIATSPHVYNDGSIVVARLR